MSYYTIDLYRYARSIARKIGGRFLHTEGFDNKGLPNPINYLDNDVIISFDEIYVKYHNNWLELDCYRDIIYNFDNVEQEIEVEDTTKWLTLLEG